MQDYLGARKDLLDFFSKYIYLNDWSIRKVIRSDTALVRYLIARFKMYFPNEYSICIPWDAEAKGDRLVQCFKELEVESIKKSILIIERWLGDLLIFFLC